MRRGKYEKVTIPAAPVVNIAMCLALVLFALVAVTVYLAQGLYARYITQDTGSDSARVMKFGQLTLIENNDPDTLNRDFTFIPGVNIPKDITVSFTESEADVFVFVAVNTTGWETADHQAFSKTVSGSATPLLSWAVNTAYWQYLTEHTSEGETFHVYYKLIKANNAITNVPFIADGIVTVREATRAEYAALAGVPMKIHVTSYAVQANGFSAVTEWQAALDAYNAVKN